MNPPILLSGIDNLLNDPALVNELKTRRFGYVGHPASTTSDLIHGIDALVFSHLTPVAAFGPQHGMRGDKQDNMVESRDYIDDIHGIPVYSLYGEHRRPTPSMLEGMDTILFDLQDIGCRIYTFLTTLVYFMEACAHQGIDFWILDRPNPAGRKVEGLTLISGQESFVGCDQIPMRHGLTLGEFAFWYKSRHALNLDLKVIRMKNYSPGEAPGFGWPLGVRPWINPSPNASSLNMARCFPGTVLLEGTELSEGRGTTTPLEILGAPDLPMKEIMMRMDQLAPAWIQGVKIRSSFFEPTFHKHQGQLCTGFQLHTDFDGFDPDTFSPFRLVSLFLKSLRLTRPEYAIWRYHQYEYELDRIPIDVINGSSLLREWVDDNDASVADLEALLQKDEREWLEQSLALRIY